MDVLQLGDRGVQQRGGEDPARPVRHLDLGRPPTRTAMPASIAACVPEDGESSTAWRGSGDGGRPEPAHRLLVGERVGLAAPHLVAADRDVEPVPADHPSATSTSRRGELVTSAVRIPAARIAS